MGFGSALRPRLPHHQQLLVLANEAASGLATQEFHVLQDATAQGRTRKVASGERDVFKCASDQVGPCEIALHKHTTQEGAPVRSVLNKPLMIAPSLATPPQ
jgi:hypothetical protein